jgi:hypothetical protein
LSGSLRESVDSNQPPHSLEGGEVRYDVTDLAGLKAALLEITSEDRLVIFTANKHKGPVRLRVWKHRIDQEDCDKEGNRV